MRNYLRFFPVILILCTGTFFVTAQEISKNSQTVAQNTFTGDDDKTDKDKKAAEEIKDPLIKILLSKGLITLAEAQALAANTSPATGRRTLASRRVPSARAQPPHMAWKSRSVPSLSKTTRSMSARSTGTPEPRSTASPPRRPARPPGAAPRHEIGRAHV